MDKHAKPNRVLVEIGVGGHGLTHCLRRSGKSTLPIVVVLVVVAAIGGGWWWTSSQSSKREEAAKKELGELGALAVMDTQGTHVASVNLSTMPADRSLERAIELLAHFPALNSLDASRTPFNSEHAAMLSGIESLNTVTLIKSELTNDGLVHLAKLPRLEALNLSLTKITDAGLEALQACAALKVLDLSGTDVSGNLAPLAQLPNLTWLVLRNCTLEDGALDSLAAATSLQRLSLGSATVSDESIQRLKQKLPELSVGTGSFESTGDMPDATPDNGPNATDESTESASAE